MNNHASVPVGVLGASGYVGHELLRLLSGHPNATVAFATAESAAGERVDGQQLIKADDAPWQDAEIILSALPHGVSGRYEHELATQCLVQRKPKSMRIRYEGDLGYGVTAKDLILGTIGQMGVDGAVGHVVEYAGPAIEALTMEGRMTVCNMTIEGGGRAGMVAPDETTFAWVGEHGADVDPAWGELPTDDGASFDREVVVDAGALSPM